MAVCAELNERDMGLLLAVRHPSTFLEVCMRTTRVESFVDVGGVRIDVVVVVVCCRNCCCADELLDGTPRRPHRCTGAEEKNESCDSRG